MSLTPPVVHITSHTIGGRVAVYVRRDDTGYSDIVPLDGLRTYVEHLDASIWRQGQELAFCATPGCNSLIDASQACPLCDACLQEYNTARDDHRAEQEQARRPL